MRITVVLAAVLGAALIVSCGDGEEEGPPPPAATATTEVASTDLTPADLVARLPALVITVEDVPAGFMPVQSRAVPNDVVAAGDPFPEQRLQELEETGRVGGYQIIFGKESAVISALLSVYETAEGAQRTLDWGVRFGLEVEATPVEVPDLGLPAAAWEVEEQTGSGIKGYVIVARKGRLNVSVSYGDVGGAGRDEAEELLRAQIAKLGDLE